MLYHLFNVSAYKGGELRTAINLDLKKALYEYFGDEPLSAYSDYFLKSPIEEVYNNFMDDFEKNSSIYARFDSSTPEIFIIKNDKLISYEFTKEQILNWLEKEIKEELRLRNT